jgi:hypothetical protein
MGRAIGRETVHSYHTLLGFDLLNIDTSIVSPDSTVNGVRTGKKIGNHEYISLVWCSGWIDRLVSPHRQAVKCPANP